jgi:coniferyl-aldehyde dehydrogenase
MSSIESLLKAQRAAQLRDSSPSYDKRCDDLRALKRLLTENADDIVDAICEDYGNRSRHETAFAELIPALDGINHALRHLRGWMKVRHRQVDGTMFPGAKNRVIPQPLGVVGLIMPWNFPINLAFTQLTCVFAAGNRAMVKMSENSVALSRLLIRISSKYFPAEKLVFLEETGGVGIEFSKLPFDLIIFTGSGQTGRAVMASASENLTPVILELGGKTPAIIDPDFPLEKAVGRIMFAKQFNAGQICTSVDYVFVHESTRERFVELAQAWVDQHQPDIHSADYTSIIDDRAYQRLIETLEDARTKGGQVINLCGEQEPDVDKRKIPLYLVLDSKEGMTIRRRETFGPLLMVMTYNDPREVIDYVNAGPTPLALYPFTNDRALMQRYIDQIPSGGVTVNDALLHVVQHDLPFGGLGQSGMGHYHGKEGFEACSKLRPVFHQARFSGLSFLTPPYGKLATRVLDWLLKLKG